MLSEKINHKKRAIAALFFGVASCQTELLELKC